MRTTQTLKKTALADWHPADIVASLRKSGWTLRRLSVFYGLHPDTLRHALNRPYPRAERIIADALGTPPEEIWPARYEARRQSAHKQQSIV